MLNEYIELKEYTDKKYLKKLKESKKPHRLEYTNMIMKGCRGLARPLLVITKYYMELYADDYDKTNKSVNNWLGFTQETNENKNNVSDSYFTELLKFYSTDDSKKRKVEKFKEKDYKSLKKTFNTKSGNERNFFEYTKKNNENAITFEKIYYTVLGKKLNRKLLVSDVDIFDLIPMSYLDNKNKKDLKEKDKDHILKLFASYLLNRIVDDADGVCISMIDLLNWSVQTKNRESVDNYLAGETWLVKNVGSSSNSKIIKIDDKIINHFHLVDYEKANDEIKVGDIVYIDNGKKLLEHVSIKNEKAKKQLLDRINNEIQKSRYNRINVIS